MTSHEAVIGWADVAAGLGEQLARAEDERQQLRDALAEAVDALLQRQTGGERWRSAVERGREALGEAWQ